MKLRYKPDDFFVEEITSKKWNDSGKYSIFKVEKVMLPTFAAEKVLARRCKVSFRQIGFAGLKDARARTIQYFSVETNNPSLGVFEEERVKSELVGFTNEPLRTGDLAGNKFRIMIRDVENPTQAMQNYDAVKQGVPNYFDDQRFGSLKGTDGFIAKDVLLGDYESAVKKIITAEAKRGKFRALRTFIREHWGDWKACIDFVMELRLDRTAEAVMINHLKESNNDFKGAFQYLFRGVRQIFFSAYHAYVWNECVKMQLTGAEVPYAAGTLVFPKEPPAEFKTFPMVAPDMVCSTEEKKIIDAVLQKEGISLDTFKSDEHIFIARERDMFVVPKDLSIMTLDDEVFKGKKKVMLNFFLQKGSYATIVMKALFEA